MRTSTIIPCLVVLGQMPAGSSFHHTHNAFVNRMFSVEPRSRQSSTTNDNYDALLEAEEAAAVDAHDVSDPGIEGAAMERAVIMAAELKNDLPHHKTEEGNKPGSSWIGKIKSLFHHDDRPDEDELSAVSEAEANFAHDLSDAAAMEHANAIFLEDETEDEEEDLILPLERRVLR